MTIMQIPLFRGKTPDGKWAQGCGLTYNTIHGIYRIHEKGNERNQFDVIPETVGMGVKLPDGRWLFHGDIIRGLGRIEGVNYILLFNGQELVLCHCMFKDEDGNPKRWGTFSRGLEIYGQEGLQMEVIGNQWDTPQLLSNEA